MCQKWFIKYQKVNFSKVLKSESSSKFVEIFLQFKRTVLILWRLCKKVKDVKNVEENSAGKQSSRFVYYNSIFEH